MKSVKLDEKTVLNINKVIKGFGMSRKGAVNLILRNLSRDDIFLYMKREQGEDWEPATFEEVDDDEELEVVFEGEDEDEDDWKEESEEDFEVEEFSLVEIKRKRLELDAIKANIISKEDIKGYVDENYTD